MDFKLACLYPTGNYYELRRSTIDYNLVLVFLNGVFVGTISYFRLYKIIIEELKNADL